MNHATEISVPPEPKNVIYGLYCACETCEVERPHLTRYVGQTTRGLNTRASQHRWTARNKPLWPVSKWMVKHGIENIRYRVLESCQDPVLLDDREVAWIEELGTLRTVSRVGLNAWPGGRSVRGYKWSDEQRESARGPRHSEETKKRFSEIGKTKTGELGNNAHITDRIAGEIKVRLWAGQTSLSISLELGITRGIVSMISAGRSWKDTPWPIGPRKPAPTRRFVPGQVPGNTKMTEEQVRTIRQRYDAGEHYNLIASDYPFVTPENIYMIVARKTWKHVE